MQSCLAGILGIEKEEISVKATTTEKLGFEETRKVTSGNALSFTMRIKGGGIVRMAPSGTRHPAPGREKSPPSSSLFKGGAAENHVHPPLHRPSRKKSKKLSPLRCV